MTFTSIPEEHRLVPINIRGDAARQGMTVHKRWTDVGLLNLHVQSGGDRILIESSLGLDPKEVLVK